MDKNEGKSMEECLQLFIKDLRHLQHDLDMELRTDKFIHNKLVNACQELPACQYACFKSANSLAGLINDLRSSIATYQKSHSESSQAFFTDRRYHKQYGRPQPHSSSYGRQRYNSQDGGKKKCFVCNEPGCWSTKHSKEECEESKKKFKERFSQRFAQRFDRHANHYIADYEGSPNSETEDDLDDAMEALIINIESPPTTPVQEKAEGFFCSSGAIYQAEAKTSDLANRSLDHAITGTSPVTGNDNSESNPFAYTTSNRYTSKEFYGVMIDTGASKRSTAGYGQYLAYKKINNIPVDISKAGAVHVQFANRLRLVLERSGHGDNLNKKTLEHLIKYCSHCQKHGKLPGRFKFILRDDVNFNYSIIVDIMYIDNSPILHIVDEATRFQAAKWLSNISAKHTWDILRLCWIDVYIGPPDYIIHDAATSKPVKLASEEQLPELRESIIALGHQFHWFVISGIPNAKILKETDHLCIKIIYQYYSYDPPSEPTGRSRSSRRNCREGSVIPISSTGSSVVETLGPKFPTNGYNSPHRNSSLSNYHKVPALSIPQTSPETDAPTTEPSQSSTASPLEKEPRPVTDSTSVETHQLIVNLPTKEASALEEAIHLAGIEEENLEEERETIRDGKQRATSHNRLSTEEVSGSHTIEERELLIQEASLAQEKADIKVRLLRKARDEYDRKEFARGLSGKRNQLAVEQNLEKEQRLLEQQRLEQADVKQDRLEQERLDQRAEGSLQEQPHFNMSNQEGSSNPRSSGLPSSSNHPFSGNAFSAEQIRVLSQLFDEKLRLSANLQGPPRPPGAPGPAGPILHMSTPASFQASDLGFFHPDVPESYGTGNVIFNLKETIYQEVYTFIKRVEDYALLVGEEKVAENLSTCLRGNALNWYLQELDDFTRQAL
ncbi:integrase and r domain-containing protein [Lasallia pustulata]|uniref:Integrase and r domain-containing protein n=1 Tax=Lasallia pustulata TaxID=136370 RepID=A0A1W5CV82_9LECA|nr:integrase and r domain-containing protein [Lasallia pustulata]